MRSLQSFANGRHAYVDTLARALRHSRSRHCFPETASPTDNAFAADHLLAKIFHACENRGHFDRDKAQQALSTAGISLPVSALETRSLVQFPADRIYFPASVRRASFLRQPVPESAALNADEARLAQLLSEDEKTALSTLIKATNSPTERTWISKERLETLHAAHLQAFPATPAFQELFPSEHLTAMDRNGVAGFYLEVSQIVRQEVWDPSNSQSGSRALAIFWEKLLLDVVFINDHQRFHEWWSIAEECIHWIDAPEFMSGESKKRFLTACQAIVTEQALPADHGKELERFAWEFRDGAPSIKDHIQEPVADAPLLDWFAWFHRNERQYMASPERTVLENLIAMIVIHDSPRTSERTLALLAAAEEKPCLLRGIAEALEHQGRPMLAGVISELRKSSLGMMILMRLDIDESPDDQWHGGIRCQQLKEDGLTRLWKQAVNVLMGALRSAEAPGQPFEARELAEVLLITARAMTHRGMISTTGPKERWQILVQQLSGLDHPTLSAMLSHLVDEFGDVSKISARYQEYSLRMPVAEFHILFWILETAARSELLDSDKRLALTDKILQLYCQELARATDEKGGIAYWLDDEPGVLQLPWTEAAIQLGQSNRAQELIEPQLVSLDSLVAAISAHDDSKPGEKSDRRFQQLSSAFHKIRLHLRVLLSIHGVLSARNAAAARLSAVQREAVLAQIRTRIKSLLSQFAAKGGTGGKSLFDFDLSPPISTVHTQSIPPLVEVLIDGISQFPAAEAEACFAEWIAVEDDPRILLAISLGQVPEGMRERALQRLDGINVEGFITEAIWITDLIQLGQRAGEAGRAGIAEKILKHGDAVMAGRKHPLPEWQSFAFRTRLLLAFKEGDLGKINSLALPPGMGAGLHSHGSMGRELEDSRRFYRALVNMERAPDVALKEFEELHKEHPDVSAYVNNAYAVSNEIANKISDPDERKREYGKIVGRFEQQISGLTLHEENAARFAINRLISLDGAEEDARFDHEWAKLRINLQTHIDFLEIAVANARRRELPQRVESMLNAARPYNLTAADSESPRFAALAGGAGESPPANAASLVSLDVKESGPDKLRASFLESTHAEPKTLVQIFGGTHQRVDEFLWQHLVAVADEFMKHRKIYTDLKQEDLISDVILSLLRMRLAFIKTWHVADQSRGGESKSGKGLGERDGVVSTSSGELAILEALRLDSVASDEINTHVQKLVKKYDSQGKRAAFLIVYYQGSAFRDFWGRYVEHVRNTEPVENATLRGHEDLFAGGPLRGIRGHKLQYEIDGLDFYLYHLALDLSE